MSESVEHQEKIDNNNEQKKSELDEQFVFLIKRIKKVRGSRIEASKRLRKKHNYLEKVSYFYSLILLILSVWYLNQDGGLEETSTKMLLILSLSLTFFTMFLNIKNYKERAGNFESNFQQLDVLLNKMDRDKINNKINVDMLKQYHREYEKMIIGKENHLNIDYYNSSEKRKILHIKEILNYRIKEIIVNVLIAIYPIVLFIIILLYERVLNLFN
ncbi:SLATT domain-containing protein [Gracilibacillus marinus]|uniref:SLATT domain-containing protein n=1 Tax=Gracilibacillus marinus TaxID=630535 RepID=A0ABV8VSQ6_9BACI